jgi:hypothetical protein
MRAAHPGQSYGSDHDRYLSTNPVGGDHECFLDQQGLLHCTARRVSLVVYLRVHMDLIFVVYSQYAIHALASSFHQFVFLVFRS